MVWGHTNVAGKDFDEIPKRNREHSLCSPAVRHLRSRIDRLRRQRPYLCGCEQWPCPCPCPWRFGDHHLLTSQRDGQPGLFGLSRWLRRYDSLHVVRLSGPSKQSLVECVNGGDHWHAGCAGHDIAHVYASRQFDSFPKRSTTLSLTIAAAPAVLTITTTSLPAGTVGQFTVAPFRRVGDGSADLEPRRRGRDTTARPEFEPDDRRD